MWIDAVKTPFLSLLAHVPKIPLNPSKRILDITIKGQIGGGEEGGAKEPLSSCSFAR